MNIGILDYGLGNIGSIKNMISSVSHCNIICIKDESQFDDIDKLILPGVGSFDAGVELLKKGGFFNRIKKFALSEKRPILGICLGMQLLGNFSEEGSCSGLRLIDFDVIKFNVSKIKIPHMGWNYVKIKNNNCNYLAGNEEVRFYFVHSYHAVCNDCKDIWMVSNYGYEFVAAVHRDNIYGVQFHPEKSHRYGKKLVQWFVEEA